MPNKLPLKGGCNCGEIRYEIASQPFTVVACHCTNCRKQAGAAYSVNVIVPASAVSISGNVASYEDRGDESGQPVVRQFCDKCGSPIQSVVASTPKILAVKAGTLDDPSPFPPAIHIWTKSKLSWVEIPEGTLSFEGTPPAR